MPLGVKFKFVSVVVVVIVLVLKFTSSTCNAVKLIPVESTDPDAVLPALKIKVLLVGCAITLVRPSSEITPPNGV